MRAIIFILFLLCLILETTVTTIPLIFLLLLNLTVVYKKPWIFPLGFIMGIILDLLLSKTIGVGSIYFTLVIFMVLSYQRKFEINTMYFIFLSSVLGSLGYLLINGYNQNIVLESILSSIIGIIFFKLISQNSKIKS